MPRWKSQTNPNVLLLCGEPHEEEQAHHIIACNDYLRMGRGRSLKKLRLHYQRMIAIANAEGLPAPNVPTTDASGNVIAGWSSKYSWVKRSESYDMMLEERRNMQAESILTQGFAQTHERVALLDELVQKVMKALDEKGLYATISKGIVVDGELKVIKELEFRRGELREVRGLLEDIAAETGGRIHRNNVKPTGLAGILSGAATFERDTEDADWEPIEEDAPKKPKSKAKDKDESAGPSDIVPFGD